MRTRIFALAIVAASVLLVSVPAPVVASTTSCDDAVNALNSAFAGANFAMSAEVAALIPPVVRECPPVPGNVGGVVGTVDNLVRTLTGAMTFNCLAGTGYAPYPSANVHTVVTIGGTTGTAVTQTIEDQGAATATYTPNGATWTKEYWTEGFGSFYGILSHDMNAPSYIFVDGTPMQADAGDAHPNCAGAGNVCMGDGWATIARADLTITVSGDFNRCAG